MSGAATQPSGTLPPGEAAAPLVSAAWLAAHLSAPGLVIADASFYLLAEAQDARANYRAGHIPGAIFFDIEDIADRDTDLPHMVPSAGRFGRLIGALGITPASHVVFYDQKGLFSAARGWWLMRLFSHHRVSVLDGGLPAWRAGGQTLQAGEAQLPAAPPYPACLHNARLRGLGDMLENAASQAALVLDARAAARFTAEAPEPRPNLPAGHMPGARSLPASSLLAQDQTMLPPDQLRALFAACGDDGSRPVITSCGTGVTAAILTLGRVVAGLPEGSLYDGSWTEWASRSDTPKVTGP